MDLKLLLLWTPALIIACDSPKEPSSASAGAPMESLEHRVEFRLHQRLIASKQQAGAALSPFVSDGCSGGLSAGWEHLANTFPDFRSTHGPQPVWHDCCVKHDRVYHQAGGREFTAGESMRLRKTADQQLRRCVLATGTRRGPSLMAEYDLSAGEVKALYGQIADMMYRAVRLGGVPCSGLPWRWGYGWPDCKL